LAAKHLSSAASADSWANVASIVSPSGHPPVTASDLITLFVGENERMAVFTVNQVLAFRMKNLFRMTN
jgi:hypothetical protein